MISTLVNAAGLSCLLHRDYACERVPEPFRMQKDVSFYVTYSAYVNYIIALPSDTLVKLSAPVSQLKELALTSNRQLISFFLQDIAFAILKEVFYAERYNSDASKILPFSYAGIEIKATDLLCAYAAHYSPYREVLGRQLLDAGFVFTREVTGLNAKLYSMAVSLYGYALSSKHYDEVNLVYDLG